jgi:hypothetical protein
MAKASKKTKSAAKKQIPGLMKEALAALPTEASVPVDVNITFFSGIGQATISLFRKGILINMQSTSTSSNIHFSEVQSGDIIAVNGVCTGNATLTITGVSTSPPTPTNFGTGSFNMIYGVL